jgi:hypothetical protein
MSEMICEGERQDIERSTVKQKRTEERAKTA